MEHSPGELNVSGCTNGGGDDIEAKLFEEQGYQLYLLEHEGHGVLERDRNSVNLSDISDVDGELLEW